MLTSVLQTTAHLSVDLQALIYLTPDCASSRDSLRDPPRSPKIFLIDCSRRNEIVTTLGRRDHDLPNPTQPVDSEQETRLFHFWKQTAQMVERLSPVSS